MDSVIKSYQHLVSVVTWKDVALVLIVALVTRWFYRTFIQPFLSPLRKVGEVVNVFVHLNLYLKGLVEIVFKLFVCKWKYCVSFCMGNIPPFVRYNVIARCCSDQNQKYFRICS